MAPEAQRTTEPVAQSSIDKFAARRAELAESALLTLSELGYARTSLREIAANSQFSHGVLHYYFTGKLDLITHCVRVYKAECVKRYDDIRDSAQTAEQLRIDFAQGLAATMAQDAKMHRLWYDLRSQALFEAAFRVDVCDIDTSLEIMVWRIVRRYCDLAGSTPAMSSAATYAMLDGLFQQALLAHLSGRTEAREQLVQDVMQALDRLVMDR